MITENSSSEEGGDARLLLQNSFALLQKSEFEKADALLAKAYELQPNNADVLNLLGIRSYQKQQFESALALLYKANLLAPHSAQTLGNIGLVYNALEKYSEALRFFDLSIAVDERIPETHNNRGNALKGLSNDQEAFVAYEKAISLRPNYAEALNNQGVIFLEAKKLPEANSLFERAIEANPNFAIAYNNLGNALTQLRNYEFAFQCFERAIQLHPSYIDAYINFGNSLKKFKAYSGAVDCYQHALTIEPRNALIFNLLGDAYYEVGDADLAKTYYAKSLELNPNNYEARLALMVAQIPKVYRDQAEVSESRRAFIQQLEFLQADSDLAWIFQTNENILSRHPFYLAYQDANNEAILSKFGEISVQLAQLVQKEIALPQKCTGSPGKIRVGIVSNHFSNHPVWHAITKGLVSQLNPDLFELLLFNTNGSEDLETVIAKSKGEYFYLNQSVAVSAQFIRNENLDVLLYPEIGMDTVSRALACFRLAPLQIAAWGHPETSGLPTIDCYLSADLFETSSSNLFYSEELIRLPNLGAYVEFQAVQKTDVHLTSLGINPDKPMLICAGSPSKYAPEHDHIFTDIARRLGSCQFIFFDFEENLTSILKDRLKTAFSNANLEMTQFVHFIPFLKKEEFHGLMQKAHLYLDTIGFSGFNTAIQALLCDLPIITIEGEFMRGKLASGILRRMGTPDLICHSTAEYIDRAVKFIQNQDMRNGYKKQISENLHIIFADQEPIRSLETLLLTRTKKAINT
ncbi:glycosyltransferase family 41 protein [Polynucleobacter sp. AP-Titi-500A-B4]|uniref:tetratricopeptide repeat protein n=1 Tax=Polynucleobacter sp. AP-Titi-500A-B4 TaxID=2576923 RepID=UPI001BFE1A32|nr:glycosyltransferase family 41 protein [Polynucleobacter sp. AP-Titi-500A-B4]QWE12626.1 tetratricopeptide repeat protein [Polynucleobacter sp. AP-Titi-500A-B4]